MVAEDGIAIQLREGGPLTDDACTHVVIDLVVLDAWIGIKHDDAIRVVSDGVAYHPAEPDFDHEDTLLSRGQDLIVDDHAVRRHRTAESDVRFVVLLNSVSFDVRICALSDQNALRVVKLDLVLNDRSSRIVFQFDPSLGVIADGDVLFNSGKVLITLDHDAKLLVVTDCAVLDGCIASQPAFGNRVEADLVVVIQVAHHYRRLG